MAWDSASVKQIGSTSMTFQGINDNILTHVQEREGEFKKQIKNLGSTPSTQALLVLQQKMQEWSMLVDLQAMLCKTFSETMKGVIQKSG